MAKQATIRFGECEHGGDLDMYQDALISSGAKILESSVDPCEEEGTVKIEVEDPKAFIEAFKKTDEYEFSSLAY